MNEKLAEWENFYNFHMVLLRAEHPTKYSENDYNEKHTVCPVRMSISQSKNRVRTQSSSLSRVRIR